MSIGLISGLVLAASTAWFWVHCARPMLVAAGARSVAFRIVLGLTVLAIVGVVIHVVALLTNTDVRAGSWIRTATSSLYIVIVGLGFLNGYRLLIKATGGPTRLRGRIAESD